MDGTRSSIGPFAGATDVPARIGLPSEIDSVRWSVDAAAAGDEVRLDVRTRFVGNGAPVTVEVVELTGRPVWRGAAKVAGGSCLFDLALPADIDSSCTGLIAMVRLPRHEIDASTLLKVVPPVVVTRAYWDKPEAEPGEIIRMFADVQGAGDASAAAIRVFRAGPDGLEEPVGEPSVALVTGRRLEASWAVPGPGALRPIGASGPPAVDLVFRLTVDRARESVPSGRLRVNVPAAPPR